MYASGPTASEPQHPHPPPHSHPPSRQWNNSPHQAQYENGPYPSRPTTQAPQASGLRPDRPEMAILHPQPPYQQQAPPPPQQQQDWGRLPPAGTFYAPPGPPQGPPPPHGHHDPYRPAPPQQPQQNMGQSAPRQRTAIACKYCRRRKIRCSGFENSEDGRCSNCVRFSQECVFTPVSAQTQAFVPAQALYARGRGPASGPQPLYGAYGQRLPTGPEAYPPHYQLPAPHPAGPYPPPPHPGQQYSMPSYPQQPMMHDQNSVRRRPNNEPHTPTLPPPNPGANSHMARPDEQQGPPQAQQPQPGYAYPDPSSYQGAGASPVAVAGPYQTGGPQPYYGAQQPPRRTSPNSVYSYEQQPRDSSSPNNQSYNYPPTSAPQAPTLPSHGGAVPSNNRTSPPHSASNSRAGMSIQDIVSESGNSGGERAAADSDMVNALNRAPRRA